MGDLPEGLVARMKAVNAFANRIAEYVTENVREQPWLPHRWMVEAVTVVLSDPGAATEALALVPTAALIDALLARPGVRDMDDGDEEFGEPLWERGGASNRNWSFCTYDGERVLVVKEETDG